MAYEHYLLWFASMKRTRSVPERRRHGKVFVLRRSIRGLDDKGILEAFAGKTPNAAL